MAQKQDHLFEASRQLYNPGISFFSFNHLIFNHKKDIQVVILPHGVVMVRCQS